MDDWFKCDTCGMYHPYVGNRNKKCQKDDGAPSTERGRMNPYPAESLDRTDPLIPADTDHFAEAEKWLQFAETADRDGGYEAYCTARAQVHATLAVAAATAAQTAEMLGR